MAVKPEDAERIRKLKKEKDAVILAHYYVPDEVQEIADFVGDSYGLAVEATKAPQKVICFAGVEFMCESAKILNPDKTVLIPEPDADCPMAHMADPAKIREMREKYDDLAVVCYINSAAETKTYADVIVTSSNAVKIVRRLPNKNIFFIPDRNLGRFVAEQCPEKNIILNDGYCHVHADITKESVEQAKAAHPGVKLLAHPECKEEVLALADYIGSTAGIIRYATESSDQEFLIGTELGVLRELKEKNPGKTFYPVADSQCCEDMKKITLDKVIRSLEQMGPTIEVAEERREKASLPLRKMLELAE